MMNPRMMYWLLNQRRLKTQPKGKLLERAKEIEFSTNSDSSSKNLPREEG